MSIDDKPTPNELRVLELEKEVKRLADRCQFYEEDAAAAWDKCEEYRKRFAKYGQHLGNCAGPGHCDCGFTASRGAADGPTLPSAFIPAEKKSMATEIYDTDAAGRAQFRNAYREELNKVKALTERVEDLEAALKKHHTGIGCINYCRTCGGHFNWQDPDVAVSFHSSGGAADGT